MLGMSCNTVRKYLQIYYASGITCEQFENIIGEKIIADAVLDRIVHQSLRVELFGESLRGRKIRTESVYL